MINPTSPNSKRGLKIRLGLVTAVTETVYSVVFVGVTVMEVLFGAVKLPSTGEAVQV